VARRHLRRPASDGPRECKTGPRFRILRQASWLPRCAEPCRAARGLAAGGTRNDGTQGSGRGGTSIIDETASPSSNVGLREREGWCLPASSDILELETRLPKTCVLETRAGRAVYSWQWRPREHAIARSLPEIRAIARRARPRARTSQGRRAQCSPSRPLPPATRSPVRTWVHATTPTRPEQTLLHRTIREQLEDFLARSAEGGIPCPASSSRSSAPS
jgi:hypothetical protein